MKNILGAKMTANFYFNGTIYIHIRIKIRHIFSSTWIVRERTNF